MEEPKKRDRSTVVYFEVGDKRTYEMIDEYRRLQGLTWRMFLLRAIANETYRNSPQISEQIIDTMDVNVHRKDKNNV